VIQKDVDARIGGNGALDGIGILCTGRIGRIVRALGPGDGNASRQYHYGQYKEIVFTCLIGHSSISRIEVLKMVVWDDHSAMSMHG
jgi:hypothetical protein